MLYEFRQYTIKPGRLKDYVQAFDTLALPAIHRHMELLGFWTSDTGDLNKAFHLWRFDDEKRRTECYAALRADPEYIANFLPVALPLIDHMHSTLLNPAEFSIPPLLFR